MLGEDDHNERLNLEIARSNCHNLDFVILSSSFLGGGGPIQFNSRVNCQGVMQ